MNRTIILIIAVLLLFWIIGSGQEQVDGYVGCFEEEYAKLTRRPPPAAKARPLISMAWSYGCSEGRSTAISTYIRLYSTHERQQ